MEYYVWRERDREREREKKKREREREREREKKKFVMTFPDLLPYNIVSFLIFLFFSSSSS